MSISLWIQQFIIFPCLIFKQSYVNKENLTVNFIPMEQENQIKFQEYRKEEFPKPQLVHQLIIDNSEFPFIPKIKEKLSSKSELNQQILEAQQDPNYFFSKLSKEELQFYQFEHPYLFEIKTLQYTSTQLELSISPRTFINLDLLGVPPLTYIETQDQLHSLLEHLSQQAEFAVDLEHHHYRTYQGITCLIQISTRENDFIIDPFKLWNSLGQLNKVFTDPKIVKVFHGADHDIQWLQRDFGVYVVNMFDTGQASRFLQFESFSLAFLLKKYCNVFANKQYQLADWRVRPLPKQMLKYAREDTHYLLHIYDRLRKDIIEKSTQNKSQQLDDLQTVLQNSQQISLLVYSKPILKDQTYYNLINRNKQIGSPKRYKLLKALLQLRDQIARKEDENPRFIFPNNILFNLIDKKPTNEKQLFQCLGNWGQYLRLYEEQILQLLKEYDVLEIPLNNKKSLVEKQIVKTVEKQRQTAQQLDLQDLQYEKLNTVKFPLKVTSYPITFFENKSKPTNNTLMSVKQLFAHENTTNFLFSFLDKNVLEGFKNINYNVFEIQGNRNNLTFEMRNLKDDLPKIENANEFIEVPDPNKGEKQMQIGKFIVNDQSSQQKKKEINLPQSLPNPKKLNQVVEIPPSLKQKYGTSLGRKQRKQELQPKKQVKQLNSFDQLNLNNEEQQDDDKKFKITDEKMLKQMNKIRSNYFILLLFISCLDQINEFEVSKVDPYQQFLQKSQNRGKALPVQTLYFIVINQQNKAKAKFGKKQKRQQF